MIAVVIPTLDGREESLARTVASLAATCPASRPVILRGHDYSLGGAWTAGADLGFRDDADYVMLAGDDLEFLPGWWEAASTACDAGVLPAPLIRNTDGSVQSCGDVMDEVVPDGEACRLVRFPFLSREQWRTAGPIPAELHYFADDWVSTRWAEAGGEIRVCHGFTFVHDLDMVGVAWPPEAGTWQERLARDRETFARLRGAG